VPSDFVQQSFIRQGVSDKKIRVLPYGVNLQSYQPVAKPDTQSFDVLFAGVVNLRKGVPYLLQAFKQLNHPRKRLWFAGHASTDFIKTMQEAGLWSDECHLLGHMSRDNLVERMSRSHVLVLPSIEDGFGLVIAQAMACGCPVIASENTGAANLFVDDEAGYILPIRRADLIAEKLQMLADEPELRQRLSQGALMSILKMGGWDAYGQKASSIYQSLL
jgi:alpha-maltose-1-phosphate synthase